MEKIASGVYRITAGEPEKFTPVKILKPVPSENLDRLPDNPCPFGDGDIKIMCAEGSCTLEIPLGDDEDIYGFGLQLKSFRQSGRKKVIRVNSDPAADLGDSHGPVPFYLSTAGYGVFVDTSRFATFYCGGSKRKGSRQERENYPSVPNEEGHHFEHKAHSGNMFVRIPSAKGADVYVFAGSTMKDALARYNLFSGGGAFPPLWGLGILYRCWWHTDEEHVLSMAKQFRDEKIPCDVLGLEPGWQTNAYSCTFEWDSEKYPDPERMCREAAKSGYKINLWEHCYTHPTSPVFKMLYPLSGDSYVWDGIIPDFTLSEARDVFAGRHDEIVEQGIMGFKLDECDGGDYLCTGNWGFPEFTKFPGGLDGEQMRSELGLLYQKTMLRPFEKRNIRVWGQSRASHALAAPYPYVLYSDLYDHSDFIRGLATSALGGVMWSPEVRQTGSREELIRRLQAVIFSPLAVINAYMIPSPPWKQYDHDRNLAGDFLPDAQELTNMCRSIFELRMSLVPYLYEAFYVYYSQGIPPVRPLIADYADDMNVRDIWDEFMVGDSLLFAPVIWGRGDRRNVYLPEGKWKNFFDGTEYDGGKSYVFSPGLTEILLFARDESLVPFADPVLCSGADTVYDVSLRLYGKHGACRLIVDDGTSLRYRTEKPDVLLIETDGKDVAGFEPNERYRFKDIIAF